MEREKALLEESKNKMGKILFPKFDVLVIEQIGKNISGDGQDPNVTGLYITKFASGGPEFQNCVIFDLTEETHGNANGVGTADVITRKLFDKIDFISMYTNAFTSTESAPVKIPMVASTPEDALRIAVKMCNGIEPYRHKIVWIKNTLELGEIIISELYWKKPGPTRTLRLVRSRWSLLLPMGSRCFIAEFGWPTATGGVKE